MKEFELINKWAQDRNLIKGSNTGAQMLKLYEEFGELTGGIARGKNDVIKDSVGDVVVVLTILAKQSGFNIRKGPSMSMPEDVNKIICQTGKYIGDLANSVKVGDGKVKNHIPFIMGSLQFLCGVIEVDFDKCVRAAYNEIKDRKGKMVKGVFVKEK